jgi:ABC-2 type transport system ATP-binding protein
MSAIQTIDLCKRFGWWLSRRKVVALDHLTLTVPEKVIFGFLGPNGAGKTTTIKILLGLLLPDSGESRIFDLESSQEEVRERVGYLPENPTFYSHLSGRDFLHFCGKLIHLNRLERARRTDELLQRVNLTDAADQRLEGYSRGMLQRIGIAQALMSNPDLVILDEPITGLDPMGRREVKQILSDLKDEGKTIFFSSHVLSDVEQMCDMVGILNHGRLVESGRIAEILGETGLEVWAEKVPTEALGKAEEICASVTMKDGRFGFTLDRPERRDDLLKLIRDNGGTVKEEVSKREDLEAYFLRRVQEDEEARTAKGDEG